MHSCINAYMHSQHTHAEDAPLAYWPCLAMSKFCGPLADLYNSVNTWFTLRLHPRIPVGGSIHRSVHPLFGRFHQNTSGASSSWPRRPYVIYMPRFFYQENINTFELESEIYLTTTIRKQPIQTRYFAFSGDP